MHAISYITDPDHTDATITMTMPMREWKQVRDALKGQGESGPWQIHRVIGELVQKMEAHFYPRTEE